MDITFTVRSKSKLTGLYRYMVSKDDADRTDLTINPKEKLSIKGDNFTVSIPAKSLSILTTFHLKHSDPGITVE
jgi:hypothetical protein